MDLSGTLAHAKKMMKTMLPLPACASNQGSRKAKQKIHWNVFELLFSSFH